MNVLYCFDMMHHTMQEHLDPEILRCNLASVCLQLKAIFVCILHCRGEVLYSTSGCAAHYCRMYSTYTCLGSGRGTLHYWGETLHDWAETLHYWGETLHDWGETLHDWAETLHYWGETLHYYSGCSGRPDGFLSHTCAKLR